MEEAVTRIQTRSRRFARRQLTWFRSLAECAPVAGHLTFAAWGLTMEEGLLSTAATPWPN